LDQKTLKQKKSENLKIQKLISIKKDDFFEGKQLSIESFWVLKQFSTQFL